MFKNVMAGLAAVLLGLIISGCELIIEPGPGYPIQVGDLTVYDAGYSTSYQDRQGNSYICDNYTTSLSYWFEYGGELWGWSSYLRGVTTGDTWGHAHFTPYDAGVTYGSSYAEVTYTINPFTAPLSVGDEEAEISPQTIVVVPEPQVIGYSRLYLGIDGFDRYVDLISRDIPVISNC